MNIEAEIRDLKRMVRDLHQKQAKPKWVNAHVITELTGWSSRRLQTARENQEVSCKSEGSGYLYDLNSLHPYMIKTSSLNEA